MSAHFERELADYVEYHRDPWNCVMHVFGIVFLFLAAMLPLSLWPLHMFGITTTVAVVSVIPVLIYWFWLDAVIGTTILAAAIALLFVAASIVSSVNLIGVWVITAVLIATGVACQIIGHRVFERRQPALVDNPTHLLLGPMFVMAKLLIAFGFRRDLASIITPRGSSAYLVEERQGQSLPHS